MTIATSTTTYPHIPSDIIPEAMKKFLCTMGISTPADCWCVDNEDGRISLKLTWTNTEYHKEQDPLSFRPRRYKPPSTIRRDQQRHTAHRAAKPSVAQTTRTYGSMTPGVAKEQISTCVTENSAANSMFRSKSERIEQNDLSQFVKPESSDVCCQVYPDVSDIGQQTDLCAMPTVATQTGDRVGCNDKTHGNCKISKVVRTKIADWTTYDRDQRTFHTGQRTEYLVKWTDHSPNDNTWVTKDRLDEASIKYMTSHPVPGLKYKDSFN